MTECVVVQDWLNLSVDGSEPRVQETPARIGRATACDLAIDLTLLGASSELLIEGSDGTEQNFRELARLATAAKHHVRLSERLTPLPTYVRWAALRTSPGAAERMCFTIQAMVDGNGASVAGARQIAFQDWTTVYLAATGSAIQAAGYQLDTSGFESVTVYPEIIRRNAATTSVYIECAPTPSGPWVQTAALTNRSNLTLTRTLGGASLLGNYMRWFAEETGGVGSVSFKIDCSVVELTRASSPLGALLCTAMPVRATAARAGQQTGGIPRVRQRRR